MGGIEIRNQRRVLNRYTQRQQANPAMSSMRTINAYKIELKPTSAIIYCERINADLIAGIDVGPVQTKLSLPSETIAHLRQVMQVHEDVSTIFWLERTLRRTKGLEQIMDNIGRYGMAYIISGETL